MAKIILALLITLSTACTTQDMYDNPGSFEPTDTQVIVPQCDDLEKRVEEWNKNNPDDPKLSMC